MLRNGRLQLCRCLLAVVVGTTAAPPVFAGSLTGALAIAPAEVDLSLEGTIDWAHWGLTSASSFDHRAAGGGQISNFAMIGGAMPVRTSVTKAGYSWTDGDPSASASSTNTGLRVFNLGKGFAVSVPADTEQRTVTMYVGARRATGGLVATLSDGSAAPVSVQVVENSLKRSFAVTIDYAADSPAQTLDIEYVLEAKVAASGSWVSLESATLVGGQVANQPPVLDVIADQTITEGELLDLAVLATDADGPAPLDLSETNNLPGSPDILTDAGGGAGQISWQSAVGDAAGSPYTVTVTATDGATAFSERSFSVTVLPAGGGGGTLVGNAQDAPFNTNLTTVGSTDDWVHWGLVDANSVDRKAAVVQQISDYTPVGGATPSRYALADGRYSWTDGDPTVNVNQTRTSLRVFSEGRGFEFTVPIGTQQKTLRAYVGLSRSIADFTATLSDGSAAPYSVELTDPTGKSTFLVTLQLAAASENQTLTISYVLRTKVAPTGSWIALESASLTGAAGGNQAPTLDALADQTLTEGQSLQVALSASDPDGPPPLVLAETNDLPGAPDLLTDNGDGTGELNWSSSAGDAAGSPYLVTVTATDDDGAVAQRSFNVTVQPGGGGGQGALTGSDQIAPANVSLTAMGDADWAHWARTSASSVDRKASGGNQISDYSPLDGATPIRATNHSARYSWTDGAPLASASDRRTGLRVYNVNKGFAFTAPADTNTRVLHLYLGANRGAGELTATLSDGSAAPYVVELSSPTTKRSFVVSLTYSAANAGATLNLEYVLKSEVNPTSAWASLESAALSEPSGLQLPFSESFDSALTDWMIMDEAGVASAWSVGGGEYSQANAMGFNGNSMNGAAQLGTYAYLSTGMLLTDYRVSVTARSTATSAQDIGLLARVNPATSEYVRLSRSGANSFSRLETSVGGSVSSLASNAIGILPEQSVVLELLVNGELIVASIDGTTVFAGSSADLAAGTVGLYCRDACAFDDLLISPLDAAPALAIGMPAAATVRGSSTFVVSAVARNIPAGGTVSFDVPGETNACLPASEIQSGYFESTCTVSSNGFYTLSAELRDGASALLASDSHAQVGVGEHYASVGNSITAGLDDRTLGDAASANGAVLGVQGYQAALTDRLEAAGQTAVVSNSGVPGDTSASIITERIDGVLQRHEDATRLLLTIGVNDAGGAMFTPSGLGCIGAACNGTFAGNVQGIVDAAVLAGKAVTVALAPPRFGDPLQAPHATPATHPQNLLINDEYNEVIRTQITNISLGPDLFDLFLGSENRFYLYQTNLHPNALGYQAMAWQFDQALTNSTDELFFATNLCVKLTQGGGCESPLGYKQNLLESGNPLYVDLGVTLTGSVPAVLDEGRWLQTADADRDLANTDYFAFDLPESTTIYVAYDAAATSVPAWLGGYTQVAQTISTSSVTVPVLQLYRLQNQLGSVELPGADASANGAGANYLVILVEE